MWERQWGRGSTLPAEGTSHSKAGVGAVAGDKARGPVVRTGGQKETERRCEGYTDQGVAKPTFTSK